MANDKRQETRSLAQVIMDAIDTKLLDVHTSLPGEIVSYDSATALAVVQPLIKRKYTDETTAIDLPLVSNVPVQFPRSNRTHVVMEILKGDQGMLIFQERSIDLWLESGRSVDPMDPRKFSLSDAVFVPGLFSKAAPITRKGEASSLEIKHYETYLEFKKTGQTIFDNTKTKIDLKDDGTVNIKNPKVTINIGKDGIVNLKNDTGEVNISNDGKFKLSNQTYEVIDILVQVIDKLSTTTTNTIFGPLQLNDFAFFAQKKTELETLKG